MNGNFPRQSTRVTVFFFMKLILFFVGRVRSTGVRGTVTSRQEKFEIGQKEANWQTEDTDNVSFLDSFIETKRKKEKIVARILAMYKRKTAPSYHGKIKGDIAQALEQHIEGMEPSFRSASFQQLWQELREPLTNVMRPRKLEEMLSDLDKCNLGKGLHPYEIPSDVDSIMRDLTICKIGEILEKNIESSSTPEYNYTHVRSLLKNPLTTCFKIAQLSLLMDELSQCLPRFELAGIKYVVPSKMSGVKRDVVICKVDEVLNEPYGYDGLLEVEKNLVT